MKSSLDNKKEFKYGSRTYFYTLIQQERKTLGLTVKPDLQVLVKCPPGVSDEKIEAFLQRKWHWLETQLNFFKKYQHKKYQKEYLSGDSVVYLGRQYKLLVRQGCENAVKLKQSCLVVTTTRPVDDSVYTRQLVRAWFKKRINVIFKERFSVMLREFDFSKEPEMVIRPMKTRWGSFTPKKRVILNPQLIHAPKYCLDYVIVHELCHMIHPNHSKEFYELLDSKMGNWRVVKERLEGQYLSAALYSITSKK